MEGKKAKLITETDGRTGAKRERERKEERSLGGRMP
jgi:hypothetical protein